MSRDTTLMSKITNCEIITRNGFISFNVSVINPEAHTASDKEDSALFSQSENDKGAFYVNLDGYAIIPLETFLPEHKNKIATLRKRAKIWAKGKATLVP